MTPFIFDPLMRPRTQWKILTESFDDRIIGNQDVRILPWFCQNQTSLNDLEFAEGASKFSSSKFADF
jgi:hypothetical protein